MPILSPEEARAHAGTDLGVSPWLRVDQAMLNAFAALTGDHQFIHVDPARAAAETAFGGTIAHGFLTLALLGGLKPADAICIEGTSVGLNYGLERVRFLSPVLVGSSVRARHRFLGLEPKDGGRWLLRTEATVEIEGSDRPALVAEWLTMQIPG